MASIGKINFMGRRLLGAGLKLMPEESGTWQPAADVFLTEDRVIVVMEAAGVSSRDIDITYEAGRFAVRGYRKHPAEGHSPRSFIRMEIPHGYFERTFEIPVRCDPDSVEASYRDGFIIIEARVASSDVAKDIPIR